MGGFYEKYTKNNICYYRNDYTVQDLLHGKEIDLFFGQYGLNGIVGMIISSCFMGFIIWLVLKFVNKKQITQYQEFSDLLTKHKQIREIIQIGMNLFLLISFYIMIAGFSAYFSEGLGISKWFRKYTD